jgi:hypothetical protein
MLEVFKIDQDYPRQSIQEIQTFAMRKLIPPEYRTRFNGSLPRYVSALFKEKCADAKVYETFTVDLGVLKCVVDLGIMNALKNKNPDAYLDKISASIRLKTQKMLTDANIAKVRRLAAETRAAKLAQKT